MCTQATHTFRRYSPPHTTVLVSTVGIFKLSESSFESCESGAQVLTAMRKLDFPGTDRACFFILPCPASAPAGKVVSSPFYYTALGKLAASFMFQMKAVTSKASRWCKSTGCLGSLATAVRLLQSLSVLQQTCSHANPQPRNSAAAQPSSHAFTN